MPVKSDVVGIGEAFEYALKLDEWITTPYGRAYVANVEANRDGYLITFNYDRTNPPMPLFGRMLAVPIACVVFGYILITTVFSRRR
jgi:hypothetical protein